MLGTLITEWDDGKERCQQFLKDEASYKTLADKLVEITKYYNFDGWLINIENKIEPDQVKNLHGFVKYLTEELHKVINHSQVLWYDSVINDGTLKWQDQLNEKNRMYFDACDGIFLNYTWTEEKLKNSVLLSGKRQNDVYVGVDVFGRNCYGGGGWNTNKAMKVISDHKLSAAIFAPGWVYEKLGWKSFLENQDRFWTLLSEFCVPHRIRSLPLVTSFCHGYGEKYFKNGQVAKNQPWGNLSCQQIQPTDPSNQTDDNTNNQYCTDDAYNGGGCLLVSGKVSPGKCSSSSIFSCDIEVDHPLLVSYTFAISLEDDLDIFIYFKFDGGKKILALSSCSEDDQLAESVSVYDTNFSHKVDPFSIPGVEMMASKCVVYSALSDEDSIGLHSGCHGEELLAKDQNHWTSRYYLIPATEFQVDKHIEEIGICCHAKSDFAETKEFTLKLGQLQVVHPKAIKEISEQVSDVEISDIHWKQSTDTEQNGLLLTATLSWKYPTSAASHFDIYCTGLTRDPHDNREIDKSVKTLLGNAFVNCYRLCDLVVPHSNDEKTQSINFIVQPVTYSGFKASLEKCTHFTMQYVKQS
ncbi:cytosolic endo-beta-N-acetylglucosaminidase-like isoform X2 [Ptychodera flava]